MKSGANSDFRTESGLVQCLCLKSEALSILPLRRTLANYVRVYLFALTRVWNNMPTFSGQLVLFLPVIGEQPVHIEATPARNFLAVTVDFSRDFVLVHASGSHEFGRSANYRAFPSKCATRGLDAAFEMRIVEMLAIPSEQEIHSMDGCKRKVNYHDKTKGQPSLTAEANADSFPDFLRQPF